MMATLGESYKLDVEVFDKKFVGSSKDGFNENIIFTFSDYILVYNVDLKKSVHLWKSKRGECFTSPTVYCGEYVAIINSNIIKTFEEDFTRGNRFTLNSYVHKVIYDEISSQAFVVLENSDIILLESILENPQKTSSCLQKNIICSQLIDGNFYLITQETGNHIKLTIHEKNGSLKKSVELFNSGNELISSCYNKSSNLQLVTFWSDGSICTTNVLEEATSLQQVTTLPVTKQKHQDHDMLMRSLSTDVVVVLHDSEAPQVSQLDGSISTVDLLYGTKSKPLSCGKAVKIETQLGKLFLVDVNEIRLVAYSNQQVTLSSVSSRHLSQLNFIDEDFSSDQFYLSLSPQQQENIESLKQLNGGLNKIVATWEEMWKSLSSCQQVQLFSSKVTEILLKIFIEKQPELLPMMFSTGFINTSNFSQSLFENFLKIINTEMLDLFIIHVKGIEEFQMVLLIDYIISKKDLMDRIDKIVCLPNTENELKEALTNLSYKSSETLLDYLSKRIEEIRLEKDTWFYQQIICWMSVIIDVNFANFLLYHDSFDVLVRLQQKISLHSEYFEELQKIEVLLLQMENSRKIGKSCDDDFSYKVQIMII